MRGRATVECRNDEHTRSTGASGTHCERSAATKVAPTSPAAASRARWTAVGEMSTPVTVQPWDASQATSAPSPQARSSAVPGVRLEITDTSVGLAFPDHAREFSRSGYEAGAIKGAEIDSHPAVFTKPASTIVGPEDAVLLHEHITSSVDYEAELAIVIGKEGRDIARE